MRLEYVRAIFLPLIMIVELSSETGRCQSRIRPRRVAIFEIDLIVCTCYPSLESASVWCNPFTLGSHASPTVDNTAAFRGPFEPS